MDKCDLGCLLVMFLLLLMMVMLFLHFLEGSTNSKSQIMAMCLWLLCLTVIPLLKRRFCS